MEQPKSETNRADLIEYAVDILTEALQEGYVEPVALIECVHSAAKPTLLATIRAVASLSPTAQLQVISFAQELSVAYPNPDDENRVRLVS